MAAGVIAHWQRGAVEAKLCVCTTPRSSGRAGRAVELMVHLTAFAALPEIGGLAAARLAELVDPQPTGGGVAGVAWPFFRRRQQPDRAGDKLALKLFPAV